MRKRFTILASFLLTSLGLAFAQDTRAPQKPAPTAPEAKSSATPTRSASAGQPPASKPSQPPTTTPDSKADPQDAKPSDQKTKGLGKATDKKTKQKADAAPKRSASEQLLDTAIDKIKSLKAFETDLRQTVEMLGHKFNGTGKYAVGSNHRMRFEVAMQLTDTTGTTLEVSDGSLHWRSRKILDVQDLTRVDMKRVREILNKPEFDDNIRSQVDRQLGFSGILPLLEGVRDSMSFASHEDGTVDGAKVYVLRGTWKEGTLPTPQAQPGAPTPELPGHVPVAATLWLGQETGWPHRVTLESTKDAKGPRTTITMEFLNPKIGVEPPAKLFIFEPPAGVEPADETDQICTRLTVALQQIQDRNRLDSGSGASAAPGAAPGAAAAPSLGRSGSPPTTAKPALDQTKPSSLGPAPGPGLTPPAKK